MKDKTKWILERIFKGKWLTIGWHWWPARIYCKIFGCNSVGWYDGPLCFNCGHIWFRCGAGCTQVDDWDDVNTPF